MNRRGVPSRPTVLVEHEDFEFNEKGMMVLSRGFHLRRGFCCGNGCIHCPFDGVRGNCVVRGESRASER
jgi:hypothetical protein